MSIMAYLIPQRHEMRARKVEVDNSIRLEGPVLQGTTTLEQALSAAGTTPQQTYSSVEKYDAVLRAHCRQ
jgi:hypothetical protein